MSMQLEKIQLGRHWVWPRRPYEISIDLVSSFVEDKKVMQMLYAALLPGGMADNLGLILIGPPGCGKTSLVMVAAHQLGVPVFVTQGRPDMTPDDFTLSLLPASEAKGQIEFQMSNLAMAVYRNGLFVADEIGLNPEGALAPCQPLLDPRKYLDLDIIDVRLHSHPPFKFVATSNTEDYERLPARLRSRLFPAIYIDPPAREQIAALLERTFPAQQEAIGALLTHFWGLWDAMKVDQELPSPRDAIQIFSLATKIAVNEVAPQWPWTTLDAEERSQAWSRAVEKAPLRLAHLELAMEHFREGQLC